MNPSKTDVDPEMNITEEDEDKSEQESEVSSVNDDDGGPTKDPEINSDLDEDVNDDEDDDDDDDNYDSEEEGSEDDEDEPGPASSNLPPRPTFTTEGSEDENEEDEDEDEDEDYLQKFDQNVRRNIIEEYHPELIQHNDEEVETLCKIVRDSEGNIVDPLHKTVPFITKYEKARVLGERAKQINAGAKPFINTDQTLIDGYLIALREYEEKKIPFIIRRPLPSGGSEYWKLADLEMID